MNRDLMNFVVFATGAAFGSVVTWQLLKTKYEQIAQEEIDSVKEVFSQKAESEEESEDIDLDKYLNDEDEDEDDEEYDLGIDEYMDVLANSGYITERTPSPEQEERRRQRALEEPIPYVISPEEYGELDDYETETLTLYADGVLADDEDERIEDVDRLVGPDALTSFGQYEEDSVFVRNDRAKIDFEILRVNNDYSEVEENIDPHLMEG